MKKILFILTICLCASACSKSKEEIVEIDSTTIMTEIIDDVIRDLKNDLKDPSSLKIGDFMLFAELKDKDVADRCTKQYARVKECQELATKYDVEYEPELLEYRSPFIYENGNIRYFYFQVEYYGKNGFGAYNGANTKSYIAEVYEDSVNKDGTHTYSVFLHDSYWSVFSDLSDDEYTYQTNALSSLGLDKLIPIEYKF